MSHSIYHLVKFYEVEITVVLTFERSQQIAIVSFKQCLFTKHTIQEKKTWKSMCCKSRMIIKSRNKNTFIEKYQSNFSLNTPENYIPEMLTNKLLIRNMLFKLCVVFRSLFVMCLGADFFGFILFRVYSVS